MSITAGMVKELREKTGAGMMDCKKALTENNGDMESSVDWLRKKGLAAAAKKAGRIAAEGLVGISVNGNSGAVVEVNAETDFVGRNEQFQNLVRDVADAACACDNVEALAAAKLPGGETVESTITTLVGKIGENMSLRRMDKISVNEGVVASYIHNVTADRLGRIGVLVALESSGDKEKLMALGKQLGMHIAATQPQCLAQEDIDPSSVERERSVFTEQAIASGKPEAVVEKMVEGRLRKFYEEVVLLNQTFVIDGESKVSKVVEAAAKDLGTDVVLKGFVRFSLGEGIEKKQDNFAEEVQAQLKS